MKKTEVKIQLLVIAVIVIVTAIFSCSLASCKKDEQAAKSDKKDILSFTLIEQTDTALIDNQNKKVSITVKYNANLAKLSPIITVSDKATIKPASGDTVNFSTSPVIYLVTAEDKTTQEWKIYVNKATEMGKKILTFTLTNQISPAIIDTINDSVLIKVVPTADLSKLIPTITISNGSTINPASGVTVDFSKGPVKYTITAGDGSSKVWTVKVTRTPYTGTQITSIAISGQLSSIAYGTQYLIGMPGGTNFSSLTPVFTISPGASISPASGVAKDFSQGPVSYVVTSESGQKTTWIVYALIAANDPNIKYVGRIDYTNPAIPKFSAPGVYFKAMFTGTFLDVFINDENSMNYVQVVIDTLAPVRILMNQGLNHYNVASGLSSGNHTVLICKETESGVGSLSFYGFRCEGISAVTDMPTLKMEFYGNSITCGAKMLSGTPCDLTNNNTNWNAANSAYLSYGALTARALNAQWQITAISGIGLISSCCSMGYTMPNAYDRINLTDASSPKWNFSKYVPDVVTICLGQNDGSTIVASKAFKDAYVAFINTLRSKYSSASIFLLTSPMADSSSSSTCLFSVMQTSLAGIVDSMHNAGDAKVYWVKLPHDQNHGCTGQGHPSEAEHLITAGVLETAIKQVMGW